MSCFDGAFGPLPASKNIEESYGAVLMTLSCVLWDLDLLLSSRIVSFTVSAEQLYGKCIHSGAVVGVSG